MTTIEYDQTPNECQHPLDDQVVLTHTVLTRDLLEGRERRMTVYYCVRHGRFGRWMVVDDIPASARKAVKEACRG